MSDKNNNKKLNKTDQEKQKRRKEAEYRKKVLTKATEGLLNEKVVGIEYPGGKYRESYRMVLGNSSVIATRRGNTQRAHTEVVTIKALNKHNAPVPKLLGTKSTKILIQEEIQGERLSLALSRSDEIDTEKLLSNSLNSLAEIHRAASTERLEDSMHVKGSEDGWIATLLEQPGNIGKRLNVTPPKLNQKKLVSLLRVVEPQFVKWDSRPGNALVSQDNKVFWFDWEHAGNRNRLDDMAWILGDEFVPEHVGAENRLIDEYCPIFKGPMSDDKAKDYLMVYGAFHMAIRLGLILKHMRGNWWDQNFCIENDKIGVTRLSAERLCDRGSRWAARHELTGDLSRWYKEMGSSLSTLEN